MNSTGKWNKLREAVYSPYLKHQKLGMNIPRGLTKDDWLKYHGFQNTIEFEDNALDRHYYPLTQAWNEGDYNIRIPDGGGKKKKKKKKSKSKSRKSRSKSRKSRSKSRKTRQRKGSKRTKKSRSKRK